MDEQALARQQEFWNRACKGVLKHLNDKGGMLNMADLHDHSMSKFLIQHQRFSQMMERFVNEGLVTFDDTTQDVLITQAGQDFINQP